MTDVSKLGEEAAQAVKDTPPIERKNGKMRNYRAMRDDNLLRARDELFEGGEAYDRCLERGSGDPAADRAVVEALIAERRIG
jgi:hypothetical protein